MDPFQGGRSLLAHLARHEVSGVFAAKREDLDDALIGLADTVIGKAVDLNHMRGIAMAEVAEMDVLMKQTLTRAFQSNNKQIDTAKDKTISRLREEMKKRSKQLENCLNNGGLLAVVSNSLLFSLANKYQAIRRVTKCLPEEHQGRINDEITVVGSYKEDIIDNRNMLAHAEEHDSGDGETVLLSKGSNQSEITIDEEWMSDFRQKLRKHADALVVICQTLNRQFSGTETTEDTEER